MNHSDVRRHIGAYCCDILIILNDNLKQIVDLEHLNFNSKSDSIDSEENELEKYKILPI